MVSAGPGRVFKTERCGVAGSGVAPEQRRVLELELATGGLGTRQRGWWQRRWAAKRTRKTGSKRALGVAAAARQVGS